MQNLLSVELVSIFNSSLVNVDVGNLINNDWIVTEKMSTFCALVYWTSIEDVSPLSCYGKTIL